MSGGIAYVIDDAEDFQHRVNHQMVEIERIAPDDGPPPGVSDDPTSSELLANPLRHDVWRLTTLIRRHAELTNSSRAAEILDNLDVYLPRFYKVVPIEYRRALQSEGA
jgi:glutamate synthase (NADPH/NADH) large chain